MAPLSPNYPITPTGGPDESHPLTLKNFHPIGCLRNGLRYSFYCTHQEAPSQSWPFHIKAQIYFGMGWKNASLSMSGRCQAFEVAITSILAVTMAGYQDLIDFQRELIVSA
ncbi:hypothetical protein TNCV_2950131 [Trichonephila clavipes]|nr:hypothetical protein TNCV_2950131 [Trichonephila clavipes]